MSGGVEQANLDLGEVPSGAPFRVGLNASPGSFAASLQGGALVKAAGSLPMSLTMARYGSDTLGDYWNGWLRESEVWFPGLSNAQLQAATGQLP
jgi:hypothetical protein